MAPREQLRNRYERLGRRIRFEGNSIASRFVGVRGLHGTVGTILPSGPRSAIASFGSSEGPPGQIYAYRAYGPQAPQHGLRFDAEKVLLDSYGFAVAVPAGYDRSAASRPGDHTAVAMKSVVADLGHYDWEGDQPLRRPFAETVINEMHVGGFTRHASSGVAAEKRGTYAGLIEKIPYLEGLGITAVELQPVFEFDPQDAPPGRVNYWGYQPVSFFALHHAYSSKPGPLVALDEFRDMVKALHRAGIEVILDVVFNHTTEGGDGGPTLCYRGLANEFYYILEPDKSRYADYTGCGNTSVDTSKPGRFWVSAEVHLAAMADLDDRDDPRCVVYRVDDSVGPLADAVPFLFSGELLASGWARRLRETLDAGGDPDADPAWLHRFEFLGGGGLDEDVITCHAAEGP